MLQAVYHDSEVFSSMFPNYRRCRPFGPPCGYRHYPLIVLGSARFDLRIEHRAAMSSTGAWSSS